jgi:ubiquinone/menaquinone biosynthesis C-methylase UbiE
MKTSDRNYYEYLKNRSFLRSALRKRFILKSVVKEFSGKVLDVGCGMGEFMEMYSNSYGIDPNKYIVEHCKKKGLNVKCGSAYKIPFKNGSFDGILCSNVFEHLRMPRKAMSEFKRVLKCGGRLMISVPTKTGYEKDPTHVKYWHEGNLPGLIEKYRFKIRKIYYFPFSFPFLRHSVKLNELRVVAEKG